jgi:hypothetical protein
LKKIILNQWAFKGSFLFLDNQRRS